MEIKEKGFENIGEILKRIEEEIIKNKENEEEKEHLTKEEFLKKYDLEEKDYLFLNKYEKIKFEKKISIEEYINEIVHLNVNGGEKVKKMVENKELYNDFLQTLKK